MAISKRRRVIGFDDWVILTLPSGATKLIQIRKNGTVNLGKFGQFEVDQLIGYAYGQSFEILEEKQLHPIKSITYGLEDVSSGDSRETTPSLEFKSSKDNQNLMDIGSEVQKITADDIEEMKKEGGGNEIAHKIIEKMVQGHGSFDKKTIYSQDKYLTRKQKKFNRQFTVDYLSPSNLLNYCRKDRDPERILGLSEEMLGMLMSHANVMPGGNYLVMDQTGGLIVYAMLERMQGKGTITLLHENDQPKNALLDHTNYTSEELYKMVKPINLLEFTKPEESRPKVGPLPQEEIDTWTDIKKERYYRRMRRVKQLNETLDRVEAGDFDGLIYVSTLNPVTFIPSIVPKIRGSRPIVVYSEYKEILVPLTHIFLRDQGVLLPNIYESRVRLFQTIPGKMHPTMTSIGGGGYMFSGIRVLPIAGAPAAGRRRKKHSGGHGEDGSAAKKQKLEASP